jgi:hypothetical protein
MGTKEEPISEIRKIWGMLVSNTAHNWQMSRDAWQLLVWNLNSLPVG